MMRKVGKVGARKRAEVKTAKDAWFKLYGVREEGSFRHECQSCGRELWLREAQFSHKVPRCLGGDAKGHVQPENGIASCHWCHVWLEQSPLRLESRAHLIADPASLSNNLRVEWSPPLLRSLKSFLARTTRSC